MGWAIALAGVWVLATLAVAGVAGGRGGSTVPDCTAGFYLDNGWCVNDPQPADTPAPAARSILVSARAGQSGAAVTPWSSGCLSVGPVGIEPTTEGL